MTNVQGQEIARTVIQIQGSSKVDAKKDTTAQPCTCINFVILLKWLLFKEKIYKYKYKVY